MAIIEKHPALCVFPYSTLDVRINEQSQAEIFQTCCCNLKADTFEPSPGSDPFAEIKQIQEQGQWPAACRNCKWEEDNGGQSERLRAFVEIPLDRLERFVENRQIEEYELRIKFSNLCNLACRSCSPYESSTFAKITNAEIPPEFENDISDSAPHWEFITNTILEKHNQYRYFFVHLIGGETLVQPGMQKILTWIIDQGIADQVNLRITTALTVNPRQELLEQLSRFRSANILLSIDSVGENYSYVRWPARFEKIQRNIDTLIDFRRTDRPIWNCAVSPVFSLNNIFYIQDWLDYWHNWYQQRGFAFHNYAANLVAETVHLDIQALPVPYRAPVIALLQQCLTHNVFQAWPEQMRGIYNFINTTIGELETAPERMDLWEQYLKHTAYFDKKTNMDFAVMNQRFYDLLSPADRELFENTKQNINAQQSLTKTIRIILLTNETKIY